MYKVILPPNDFVNITARLSTIDPLSLTGATKNFKRQLNDRIDMIPTRMVGNIAMDFQKKHEKDFFLERAFKCKKSRIDHILKYTYNLKKYSKITFNDDITKEIELFSIYVEERRKFQRGGLTEKGYDDSLPGVTTEDIEKGNEILRKIITYLETLQQEKIETSDNL